MNTSNKRLKVGARFPGFYFLQITHLARLRLLTPRTITYDQSLPAKNLPFPSCGRRVSPIQAASCHLQSGHGECLPATQLYLSVFTCPTVILDLPLDAGESLPARQPYLFHPTAGKNLPIQTASIFLPSDVGESLPATHLTFLCLYLSNTASLDLPLDAGEVLPARQSYFLCLYLSNTASPGISLDAGEVLPARQSYFSCLYLSNTGVSISLWTPARCSRPDNLTFPVFTCPTRESQSPVGRRRGAPGQTNTLPSARTKNIEPRRTRHTFGRFGNLSFQSTTGEVRPPGSQVSISRQMSQEPPGWTTSTFPPSSAKLTHQTGGHAHQLDVG